MKYFLKFACMFLFGLTLAINTHAQTTTPTKDQLFVEGLIYLLFNYDYQNYQSQLQKASYYFTESAWANYQKTLYASGLLKDIVERRLTMTGKPTPKYPIRLSLANNSTTTSALIDVTFTLPPTQEGQQPQQFKTKVRILLDMIRIPADGNLKVIRLIQQPG